jgi:orotidine-5'-phosphate decarboxylase
VVELIVALDVDRGSEALRFLDRLSQVRWVKVGSRLMTREGGGFLGRLTDRGLAVFLDLKWHDIPNTVVGAVEAARDLGVRMATVHGLGGPEMLEAAARAAHGMDLIAVTVLTSHDGASYASAVGRTEVSIQHEVARLTQAAFASGLSGVVCSPHEVAAARAALGPRGLIVVPGIRRSSDASGDQRRVATPRQAVSDGATHLVVGRPILTARDPAQVFRQIREEVAACAQP